MISTILKNVHNWQDFKSRVANLSTKEKGDAFELLVKYYLQINPVYKTKLKSVWLLNEVSIKLKQNLNLPDTDQGIDLVAETYEGEYWAIQCKYRDDEDSTISWREVSTFAGLSFSVCKNISFGLICTTSNRITKVLSKQENIAFCTGEIWRNLDAAFFTNLNSLIKGKIKPVKALKPRPHQKSAIKNALKHFIADDNARGKMIMPCGSGKSLTAFWIADKLQAKSILIAVPSLALIRQSLKSWLQESVANKKEIKWICVASDETVGRIKKDDIAILKQDLGVPALTDSERIATWLKENKKSIRVVFTTYQSGKSIADATKKANVFFDLGIMDEAHKTVGSRNKLFSYLLFDENIRIKKRIFMTATERRYAGLRDEILSMEDPSIYGDTFELQTFKEAIEVKPSILSDYRILTILVTRDEIEELIENNAYVIPDKGSWDDEIEAEMLASNIALQKAVEKYPIRHAISFHSSISKAQAFQKTQIRYSDTFQKAIGLSAYHVSGTMATSDRDQIIREFLKNSPSLITNARCLTEGVDIPNIDCVLFADPKRSTVDIVQAVGRALRISEGKKYGYVIIPILTNAEKGEEEILSSESFKEVLTTLRALASNDERIIEYFKSITERKKTNRIINIEIDESIGQTIDSQEFINSIELKLWNKLARLSWRPFNDARDFVHKLNIGSQTEWHIYVTGKLIGKKGRPFDIPANPSKVYKKQGWITWGDWLGTNRIATRDLKYIPFNEARNFVRGLGLGSIAEWTEYYRTELKNNTKIMIPSKPNRTYKYSGWLNWNDWLGTEDSIKNIATSKRTFLEFKDAREIVRELHIHTVQEWKKYTLGELINIGTKPDDIPSNPNRTYKDKGWNSWGDWLGTGRISLQKIKYLPFNNARKFARKLKLSSTNEWRKYCKDEHVQGKKLPYNIPSNPHIVYKNKGWINYGDWLGTGNISPADYKYLYFPFEKARKFVQSLNIKSKAEWDKYCKGELNGITKKPDTVPANPSTTYKNIGWVSWADWLGKKDARKKNYQTYNEAKVFVHKLNLSSQSEWYKYIKGEISNKPKKPQNIPSYPSKWYENKGWINWGNWLNTKTVATQQREYLPYEIAKDFVHKLNLSSANEWRKYCKGELKKKKKKPDTIPNAPNWTYRDNGWKSWGDWLGTDRIATNYIDYVKYTDGRDFATGLGLRTSKEWFKYCKGQLKGKEKLPSNVPVYPYQTYKYRGWKSWGDWLGTGNITSSKIKFRSFKSAKKFVRTLGIKNGTEWRRFPKELLPPDIPKLPWEIYKNKGWKGMKDWLGKK